MKTEVETETKVTIRKKPEELQKVTSKLTHSSTKPKKEFFSGSVEIDSDYFILHRQSSDPKSGNKNEIDYSLSQLVQLQIYESIPALGNKTLSQLFLVVLDLLAYVES